MEDKTTFDLAALDTVDAGKLLMGLVVPRPIGWVGTRSADGTNNLAPYSFFNVVSTNPPTVVFGPGMSRRVKDSHANVREGGAFTLNVVTEEVVEAMNITSGEFPPDVDEFAEAGLTAVSGDVVDAPMVAEAKANFECTVLQIVELGDPPTSAVVFGRVLRAHVRTDLLDGTRVDLAALHPVGRLAGGAYSTTRDLFWLNRPS